MKLYKKVIQIVVPITALAVMSGCTKLDEKLNSTLTNAQVSSSLGAAGTGLLLSAAYADLGDLLQDRIRYFPSKKTAPTSPWFQPGVVTGMITEYGV